MNRNTNKKIFITNFILSILIVIYHSDCKRAQNYEEKNVLFYLSDYISYIINLAVPSFFVLSSILFYRNYEISQLKNKLFRRFKSLFIPYILWNTIYCLFFLICSYLPILKGRFNSSIEFSLKDNIIGILNSQYTPLWFVKDLMIFSILSPIIYLIIKNKKIGILVCILLFIINLYFSFDYKSCLYWSPMYILGGIIGMHYKSHIFNIKHDQNKSISLFSLFLILIYTFISYFYINNDYSLYLYRFISPILLWYTLDLIIDLKIFTPKNYFKYSFFIYANHFFFLTGLQKIIYMMRMDQCLSFIIAYFIIPPIVIYFLIKAASFLENNFNNFFKVATGGR